MGLFDVDIGKALSRALGIGEETLPTVVTSIGAALAENPALAVQKATVAIQQEKARKAEPLNLKEPEMYYPMTYSGGQPMESGGYIDIPPVGQGTVYEGYAGLAGNVLSQVFRGVGQIARSPAGQVVGGVATGYALSGANDNACGCAPKAFVRFNKCGQPIITRKMKKQAIEAINCQGPAAAAAALTGGDAQLLLMISSKQFPPRRMGISGPQLNTTMRTMTKLDRAHKKMQSMCKPRTTYRRAK